MLGRLIFVTKEKRANTNNFVAVTFNSSIPPTLDILITYSKTNKQTNKLLFELLNHKIQYWRVQGLGETVRGLAVKVAYRLAPLSIDSFKEFWSQKEGRDISNSGQYFKEKQDLSLVTFSPSAARKCGAGILHLTSPTSILTSSGFLCYFLVYAMVWILSRFLEKKWLGYLR